MVQEVQQVFVRRLKEAERLTTVSEFRVVASQINFGIRRINRKGASDVMQLSGNVSLSRPVALAAGAGSLSDCIPASGPTPEEQAANEEATRIEDVLRAKAQGAAALERAEEDGRIAAALRECRLTQDQLFIMSLLLLTDMRRTDIADMRHTSRPAVNNAVTDASKKLRRHPHWQEIERRLHQTRNAFH
jgi:hypothetical protein